MEISDKEFIVDDELPDDGIYEDDDGEYLEDDVVVVDDPGSGKQEEEDEFVDPFETPSDEGAPWLVPLPQVEVSRLDSGRSVHDPQWTRSVLTIDLSRTVDLGIATWNINHMNQTKPKYFSKKCSIGRLFNKNDWLDVLVLQEINQVSLKSLPDDIAGHELQLMLGPHMVSIGPKGGKGQHEYYPIVYRGDRLACDRCWALHRGRWVACETGTTIFWTKPEHKRKNKELRKYASYRPIVVYRLFNSNGGYFYVANVHTTPKGSGLSRKHEFDQIRFILDVARARQAVGEHWIVVGDYYLDPEASVIDRGHEQGRAGRFERAVTGRGLELVIPLSATNQTGLSSIREEYGIELDPDDEESEQDGDAKAEKKLLFAKLQEAAENKVFESSTPVPALERFLQQQKRKPKSKGASDNFLADRVVLFSSEGGKRIKVVLNKRADFFICTVGLVKRFCGLVSPVSGILHVDPNHNALNWWCTVSDHAPIGAIFCNQNYSPKLTAYELEFKQTYCEELDDSKLELEKIRARVKFEALQVLEGLLVKLEAYPTLDYTYLLSRRVCVYLTCMLRLVGVDLTAVSRPIPGDVGEEVVNNQALREFIQVHAFAKDTPRWSREQDNLVTMVYAAARAAHRCERISGYVVADFDFIDETDVYDDRFTEDL
ncbi:endonuclease/exonuclease/phosphatase family protein [Nannocystis pusilla]|uniref:endonuclease/exonuclease/phosphatase family protein n=1 Tax=Nannocystis pusilla TaxID=889268 RepID=UPI003BF1C407